VSLAELVPSTHHPTASPDLPHELAVPPPVTRAGGRRVFLQSQSFENSREERNVKGEGREGKGIERETPRKESLGIEEVEYVNRLRDSRSGAGCDSRRSSVTGAGIGRLYRAQAKLRNCWWRQPGDSRFIVRPALLHELYFHDPTVDRGFKDPKAPSRTRQSDHRSLKTRVLRRGRYPTN
jgi:hypothetical protein